jgi:hypothetical protein
VSASARADAAAASQKSVIPKTTVAHRPEARRETLSRKPKLTPSLKASPPRASQVRPTEADFLPSHARLVKVVRDFSVPPQSSRKRPEIAADLVERSKDQPKGEAERERWSPEVTCSLGSRIGVGRRQLSTTS